MIDHRSTIQSLVNFQNSQGDRARGTLLKLSRSTVVFEVYNPYSIVQLSEVLETFTIRRGDRIIYEGRAVVSNLVNTGLMLIVSVTLVDAWSDLSGLMETGSGIDTEAKRFIDDWEAASDIQPGYELAVTRIRSFLSELGRWMEQIDMDAGISIDSPDNLPAPVFDELAAPLMIRIKELFEVFEEKVLEIPEEHISYHKAFAQRDLHPLMLRSPFVHRTFTKPLGYAGDYEMVNMMLRSGRQGPNSYAQLLNAYHIDARVAEAHRNRIDILTARLTDITGKAHDTGRPAKVLNIACGPAHEILNFIRTQTISSNCDISLLDFNEETLKITEDTIHKAMQESGNQPTLNFIHESVHSLLKKAAKGKQLDTVADYDFIYCAGLFDYLSDKVCTRLIKLFTMWTKPGGLILTTNVHPSNPNRGAMEHILDWYLIYRNEDQMQQLGRLPGHHDIYLDDTGNNVFFEIRNPDPT